jgi:Raf kinase inhibitor-like YbhB/YbcL family protein
MPAFSIGALLRNRRAGHDKLIWVRPDLQAPENFTLTSPAFEHGQPMPRKYQGKLRGPNISPALGWTQPPAGTAELVLIVEDPDVPIGKPATHVIALGIDPALGSIPENGLSSPSPVAGLRYGKGAMRKQGWAGPLPPKGHGPHFYVFQLYALDQALGLPAGCTLDQAIAAMKGHILGRARLDGTYEIS